MPSRAPLTDEEMQLLKDRVERYEAAKSNRTPPPAPSQTFGMRGGSSRRTGPRQRYDPEAAAEARHANRMRLAELRTKVETDKATRATAQKAKRKKIKDEESVRTGLVENKAGTGLKSGAFYQPVNYDQKTTVAEDYAAAHPKPERPISSMYSVTPSQYQAAYGVEFTGSDPDSMRRLLALQNGTGSAMNSERSVLDQRSQDAYNSRPANPNPTTAAYTGLAPMSADQMRVGVRNNIQSPEDRKVMENAERVGGITPESIDAYDRREKMKLDREGPRPEFNPMVRVQRQIENERNKSAMDPLAQSILDELNGISTTLEPSDTPSATYGPGRKGLPRGAVPRK